MANQKGLDDWGRWEGESSRKWKCPFQLGDRLKPKPWLYLTSSWHNKLRQTVMNAKQSFHLHIKVTLKEWKKYIWGSLQQTLEDRRSKSVWSRSECTSRVCFPQKNAGAKSGAVKVKPSYKKPSLGLRAAASQRSSVMEHEDAQSSRHLGSLPACHAGGRDRQTRWIWLRVTVHHLSSHFRAMIFLFITQ